MSQIAAVGPERLVNQTTSGDQILQESTTLDNGEVVDIWSTGSRTLLDGVPTTSEGAFYYPLAGGGSLTFSLYSFNASGGTLSGYEGVEHDANGTVIGQFQVSQSARNSAGDYYFVGVPRGQLLPENLVLVSQFGFHQDANSGYTDNSTNLQLQVVGPTGAVIGSTYLEVGYGETSGEPSTPFLANASAGIGSGRFATAWVDGGPTNTYTNTNQPTLYEEVFNEDFSSQTAKVALDTNVNLNTTVAMASLGNGQFVVAWDDALAGNANPSDIHYEVFNADGTAASAMLAANASTPGTQAHPSVALLGNGDFVIAWDDNSQTVPSGTPDQSGSGIKARVFQPDGTPVGNEFLVNTTTDGNQVSPQVAAIANGFVVSWTDYSNESVSGQMTDTSGAAVKSQTFFITDNVISGTPGNDTLTATSGNNVLNGYDGNDSLTAGPGTDVLDGGNGNDALVAGSGVSQLLGGPGNDIYVVNDARDQIVEVPNEGNDIEISSVSNVIAPNVETLVLQGGASTAVAGVSTSGNNVLVGNEFNNILVAQKGTDILYGGAGNDIYDIDSNTDQIVEYPNQGYDTVISSTNFQLPANVEELHLREGSPNAIVALGNGGDTTLFGNSAGNVLNGLGGNDILYGMGGQDTFQFSIPNFGHQTVIDFDPSQDNLSFSKAVFGDYTALQNNVVQSGSDVLIVTGDPNNYVTLHNIQVAQLHPSNFSFF